jgi:hypothetical protein
VQLGEELDAILTREQLIHYTAEMIATKVRGRKKMVIKKGQKNCQKAVQKLAKTSKNC